MGDVEFPDDLALRSGPTGHTVVGGRPVAVWSRRDEYQRVTVFVDEETKGAWRRRRLPASDSPPCGARHSPRVRDDARLHPCAQSPSQ